MSKLDLSSLGKRPEFKIKPIKLSPLDYIKILFIFAGVFFAIIVFVVLTVISFGISPIAGILFLVVMLLSLKKSEMKQNKKLKGRFAKLATKNNWELDVQVPEDIMTNFAFLNNESSKAKGIKGQLAGKDFWLLHDTGGGLAVVDMQREMPESYFVNSVINSGAAVHLFDSMFKEQGLTRVSLEGDFDSHFKLYIKPNAQIAPDLMDKMVVNKGVSTVVFKDQSLAISSFSASNGDMRALIEATEALIKEIED